MTEPKLNTEFGWCVFKYMFILLIFTNLLWAGIYSYTLHKASSDTITSTEMLQDGTNNTQSITKKLIIVYRTWNGVLARKTSYTHIVF